MFNIKDILETNRMITENNLDVRTMYVVKESKLQNYINSGRTKKM